MGHPIDPGSPWGRGFPCLLHGNIRAFTRARKRVLAQIEERAGPNRTVVFRLTSRAVGPIYSRVVRHAQQLRNVLLHVWAGNMGSSASLEPGGALGHLSAIFERGYPGVYGWVKTQGVMSSQCVNRRGLSSEAVET